MSYALSPELEQIVQAKLATGSFADEEQVLREALRLLDEYDSVIVAVAKGDEDIRAGRCRTFEESDAEFRQRNGFRVDP